MIQLLAKTILDILTDEVKIVHFVRCPKQIGEGQKLDVIR